MVCFEARKARRGGPFLRLGSAATGTTREIRTQSLGQGLVVGTRSGLPGELFGKISVTVHVVALSAVARTGTPGVSM